ncbi:MAG: hypothetical protein LC772_02870, partial [Chloroflexi bacterium]|nr:hypothetical protein [Chloroflexota bacterium]
MTCRFPYSRLLPPLIACGMTVGVFGTTLLTPGPRAQAASPARRAAQVLKSGPARGYRLAWDEEFHRGVGAAPDPASWGYDLGAGGWGN